MTEEKKLLLKYLLKEYKEQRKLLKQKYIPEQGDTVKIDFELIKKSQSNPNYLSIIRRMISKGGGKVYVSHVQGDNVDIRTCAHDFLGDATIPLAAVKSKA